MAELPDGNEIANLSIPGLLGALLVFFVFLPPHPINTIPILDIPKDVNKPQHVQELPTFHDQDLHGQPTQEMSPIFNWLMGRNEGDDKEPSPLAGKPLRLLLTPAMLPVSTKGGGKEVPCQVQEYQLQAEPHFPPFHPWESQTLQLYLEEQKESLQECLALELSEEGREKSENDADERQITALEKARDSAGALAAQFEDFRSPTVVIPNARIVAINSQIHGLRNRVEAREKRARMRDYEVAELKRFSGWLDLRLADPDRLRPEQSLGDYLKALSDHVTGFLALVAGIGTIFKVLISPAGSKLIYKLLFKEEM